MQLSLTFPDSGYPDVLFLATPDSLAKDAIVAAAEEWLVDAALLEISYASDLISPSSTLLSKGVSADSQLTVSLLRWIKKEILTDTSIREKIGKLIEKGSFGPDRVLSLDTPTFADDAGCVDFRKELIPEGVFSICFANPSPSVTSTAPYFLSDSSVTNIDLLGLQSITSVGNKFLSGSRSLKAVDLSCLRNVSSIGDSFLTGCSLIQSVDLGAFEKVTCVNHYFLSECSCLETISNISGLRNAKSIGRSFLGYSSITSIDLSVFTQLESISDAFLYTCKRLENIDVGAFTKVTRIDDHFLSFCFSLKTISNISGLVNVESIGAPFLFACKCLTPIDASVQGYECLSKELKGALERKFKK